MSQITESLVMDVSPWPHGRGFTGASAWWEYVLSKEESKRLDNLLGIALLDKEVCDRLLHKRDDSLLAAFGLSKETQTWLHSIKATTLVELAQGIMAGRQEELPVEVVA